MSIKSTWGRILLGGASLAAMGAAPAMAQQGSAVSEEIVVTATGRSAAIQDVPVAVTAITGEQLQNAGVARLTDLDGLAPSFHSNVGQSTTAGTVAHIRGIGTGADNPGFESAVGIFIDGVYRARTGVAMSELPELERVEVLRGPQGTLFGRNTSAGAINIVTAGPEFTPSWWADLTAGDLGAYSGHVGANLPLIEDKLAIRVDAGLRRRDGYINDITSNRDINTQDRWSARLQALFDLTPQTSLRVIFDGSGTDEVCCAAVPLVYGVTRPAIESISGASATPPGRVGDFNTQHENRNMTATPGRNYGEQVDEWGASAQFDHDFGNVDLTYIGSFRNWEATRNQDIDFNKIDIAYRDGLEIGFQNTSHELRLHGQAGRLDWLVGAYYGNEKLDTSDRIRLGADFNAYLNTLVIGNTLALAGGPYELFDTQPGACLDTNPTTCDTIRSAFFGLSGNPGFLNVYLTPSPSGSGQQRDHWRVDTNTMSLFTHDQFALTDSLTFTLGVRYNRDIKHMDANLNSVVPTCASLQALVPTGIVTGLLASPFASLINLACNPAVNPVSNGAYVDSNHETAWSGTSSLAWRPNDDLMFYIGYSRGYKSGGYNLDRSGFSVRPDTTVPPTVFNPVALSVSQLVFKPEYTDSVEGGFKSTIFEGSTDFNVTVYHEQIQGYQNNSFNGFNFITRNIPHTISDGVEVDLTARVTPHLQFNGGLAYNDAHYDSTVVFNPTTPVGNTIFKGDTLDHAPKWSSNAAVTWDHPIGDNLELTAYLDARYTSEYRNQTLNRESLGRTDQGAFALFNGRVGIGNPDRNWGIELWGRNLTDEFYMVGAFQAPVQDGTFLIYPNEPRTWGVTLRVRH